jgi:hypothetical protein
MAVAGLGCPPWFKRPWEPVDGSELKMVEGKLTGTATISIGASGPGLRRADGTEIIEKKVTFDPARAPQVTLFNRPDAAMPSSGTFWARLATSPKGGESFIVVTVAEDGTGTGALLHNKATGMGTVESSKIELKDGKLSGKVTGKIGDKATEVSLEGRLFANRMLLGEYTMTSGAWKSTERFRGGIVPEGAPALINLGPKTMAVAKPMMDAIRKKK